MKFERMKGNIKAQPAGRRGEGVQSSNCKLVPQDETGALVGYN